MSDPTEVIVTSRAADNFVSTYYNLIDRQRHLLAQVYKPSSAVLWNGTAMTGEQVGAFVLGMPVSDHSIHGYDGQPILDRGQILVTVTGTVKYGTPSSTTSSLSSATSTSASKSSSSSSTSSSRNFSQVFVLSPDTESPVKGTYFVSSDHFRFV
ncbi:hypothetical protein DFS34DRAFT_89767 [Phlyctochytrium arcticum]|nr:hypothetical protein DFS34DRAFT_89767 [Phlyctochytrium arcticum]